MNTVSHDEVMIELFRKEPEYAAALLEDVLKDGDPEEIMLLLRRMDKSFSNVNTYKYSDLNDKSYKDSNFELKTLLAVLHRMNLCLSVQPLQAAV